MNTKEVHCLGCGKLLEDWQLRRRSTAKFCSRECSRIHADLKDYDRTYNEDFLEDKKLLGYFLGFWVADGHISASKKSYGSVSLSSSDKQLVDDFIRLTGYTGSSLAREKDAPRSASSFKANYDQYAPHYTGAISKYIQKMGYTPGAKTGKEFLPKAVDDEMFPHFLRGFIDGDGTIAHATGSMQYGYPKYLYVSMVSASKDLLNSIFSRLRQLGIVRSRADVRHPKPTLYRIAFGHADAVRICNYIYADAPIKLERKYQNYLECKDLVLEKELQFGNCTYEGCTRLAVSHGLCKLHADAAYHQLHKDDPEVKERGREAVQRYRTAHHEDLLERRRELYAAEPEKHRQAVQMYRANNPEKVKEYKQEYRQTHKESTNEYKKRYRLENPELHKEMDRRKYEKNKEKTLARCKENYQKNKEKIKARCAAYREKKRKEKSELNQPELLASLPSDDPLGISQVVLGGDSPSLASEVMYSNQIEEKEELALGRKKQAPDNH